MDESGEQAEVAIRAGFDVFYADNYRPVVALLSALTRSRWVAEDLAQEAFLRAHREWADVQRFDAPAAWVRRVAINLARSRFRRLRSEAAARLRLRPGQTVAELEPADEAFWAEVRRLPGRQAQALALRYVDDLSIAQIAAVMGVAEGTVRAVLTQGRARLQRQLTAKGWID